MDRCPRCGADVDTETGLVCPWCGETVKRETSEEPVGTDQKNSAPTGAGNIRVLVSLVIFCTAMLAFLGLAALTRQENSRQTPVETDPPPVTDEIVQTAGTDEIDLDPGLVGIAVDETVDRNPAESNILTSLLREGFEEEGYGISELSDAATYIICEARSSSRAETAADGTERFYSSTTVSLRSYDTSSNKLLFARKKSAGAPGQTRQEAIDTARQKAILPLIPEIMKAVQRIHPTSDQPATDK